MPLTVRHCSIKCIALRTLCSSLRSMRANCAVCAVRWMDFEEAMACTLKPSAPPSERPRTDAGAGKLASMARERAVVVALGGRDGVEDDGRSRLLLGPWSRVVTVCGSESEAERGIGTQLASKARGWHSRAKFSMMSGGGAASEYSLLESKSLRWWHRPPLAPSLYAERLISLRFSEEADRHIIRELYRRALQERFETCTWLRYACELALSELPISPR